VSVDGSTPYHSPFTLDNERGAERRPKAIEWSAIRDQRRVARTALPAAKQGQGGISAIELLVDQDGLYRLRFEDLATAGIEIGAWPIGNLAMLAGDAPVRVVGRGTFGPGDFVELVGEAADSLYTRTNIYTLVNDRQSALRVTTETAPPSGQTPASYRATRDFARDRSYSIGSPTADPWYDTRLLAFTNARQWTFPVEIEGLVAEGEPAELVVDVWGSTVWPANPDHHLRLSLAEYLIIAHPDFLGALGPLVSLREASGLTVKTVDVETIYRQFGHGLVDPESIRDYIAFAAGTLGTRYVLLVGGDSYDYRDHLGLGSISFIPTLYADSSQDVRNLANTGRPTVVMQWGCWNTYYVEPRFNSLGHAFLVSGDRGAAAVLGSSTLLETASARELSEVLTPILAIPAMRLGDAITAAKKELARNRPDLLDVQLGWTLLGDPAMEID
jgi:hypothetical protein